MTAIDLMCVAAFGLGTTLLLAGLPWFRDRPLVERLRPYAAHGASGTSSPGSGSSLAQVIGPLAQGLGNRVSRFVGVSTDLPTRLDRAGWSIEPEAFRLRQLAHGVIALLCAGALVVVRTPQAAIAGAVLVVAPVLTVLLHEQLLSRAADARRQALAGELPVLVEQLGLLISAGYSVTSALNRLAKRSNGVAAEELQSVLLRIRHGVPEHTALSQWADRTDLDAVGRLTSILALHGETADLGLLISDEARSIRAEAHRDLLEAIERRAQLVWIPVTVATLVPGLVFLAVPFMSAMSQVTGGS